MRKLTIFMPKSIKRAHNQELNIRKISHEVFNLVDDYKGILHILALFGPQYISNITKLSKSKLSKWEVDQKQAYRRIFGTKRLFGLLEKEYVKTILVKEKRRGNPKRIICLTLKGLLASLSTGVELEQAYPFKNYVSFICKPINDPEIKKRIKNFIKYQIFLFLVWHAVNGIQLQKLVGTIGYFNYFFRKLNTNFPVQIPVGLEQSNKRIYQIVLKQFVVNSTILYTLDMLADPNRSVRFGGENSDRVQESLFNELTSFVRLDLVSNGGFQKSAENVIGLIQKWPFFMENLDSTSSDKKIIRVSTLKGINLDEKDIDENGYVILEKPTSASQIRDSLAKFMNAKMLDSVLHFPHEFRGNFRLYEITRFLDQE